MNRAAFSAKLYPAKVEEAIPEMFEKKKNAPMPDWLREDYEKKINKAVKKNQSELPSHGFVKI